LGLLLALAPAALAARAEGAEELRGFWVRPWDLNSLAAPDEIVREALRYNFNALFVEARYRGDALYIPNKNNSRYPNPEPRSRHLAGLPADFDPLGELVAKGHAAGLEVHAWVTTFVALNRDTPSPPGHPAAEHPEWLSQNAYGETRDRHGITWLEPALPQVQDYLYDVFADVVANYDVDGLHLDYVRYPSRAFGRHPKAIELYQLETGKKLGDARAFADWRRLKINAFVSRLYDGISKLRPSCRLTAAVYPSHTGAAYASYLQDWGAWLAGGYVDAVIPMAYSRDAAVVRAQIEDAVGAAAGRYIYAGIMVPGVGAKNFDEKVGAEMVAKATSARGAGAEGIVVFSYGGLCKEDSLVARALCDDVFGTPAKPPVMSWKDEAPLVTAADVVTIYVKGKPKFAVRVEQDVPRRHAYLLAKEISARADARVFIKGSEDRPYRVYAGAYGDRGAAAALSEKLAELGY